MFVESGVDLTGAEDDAGYLVMGQDGGVGVGRVGDYPLKVGLVGEIREWGAR